MPTDKRTTQWYDDNADLYTKHTRGNNPEGAFHFAFEKPAIYKHLPNLDGLSVLSIGCGPGEDVAELKKRGAKTATGIDLSAKLIALANKNHPECEFSVMDMEHLDFDDSSFDFVFSSLALHYLPNWDRVMREVHRVLRPGGKFLFSSSHPAADALEWSERDGKRVLTLGAEADKQGKSVVYRGRYLSNKEIIVDGDFAVTFYHQPLEPIMKSIINAKFQINGFWEPKPLPALKKHNPRSFVLWSELPWLMIIMLQKPNEDN